MFLSCIQSIYRILFLDKDQIYNLFVVEEEKHSLDDKKYVYHIDIQKTLKNNCKNIEHDKKFNGGLIDYSNLELIASHDEMENDFNQAHHKLCMAIARNMYNDKIVCYINFYCL